MWYRYNALIKVFSFWSDYLSGAPRKLYFSVLHFEIVPVLGDAQGFGSIHYLHNIPILVRQRS
jgi:hypothetical protein